MGNIKPDDINSKNETEVIEKIKQSINREKIHLTDMESNSIAGQLSKEIATDGAASLMLALLYIDASCSQAPDGKVIVNFGPYRLSIGEPDEFGCPDVSVSLDTELFWE